MSIVLPPSISSFLLRSYQLYSYLGNVWFGKRRVDRRDPGGGQELYRLKSGLPTQIYFWKITKKIIICSKWLNLSLGQYFSHFLFYNYLARLASPFLESFSLFDVIGYGGEWGGVLVLQLGVLLLTAPGPLAAAGHGLVPAQLIRHLHIRPGSIV